MTETSRMNPVTESVRAPDPILAELWEIKRQLNAEAGYDIGTLARMAHEAGLKIDLEHLGSTSKMREKS